MTPIKLTRFQYFPANALRFGGGGGGGGSPSVVAPATPAPTPTPPITPANAAVINIQQATRREALRKKGISSTVYAGATGGWFPSMPSATMGMIPQGGAAPTANSGPGKTGGG